MGARLLEQRIKPKLCVKHGKSWKERHMNKFKRFEEGRQNVNDNDQS
jgi:hypothetical protein